jgi:hypothetical protein
MEVMDLDDDKDERRDDGEGLESFDKVREDGRRTSRRVKIANPNYIFQRAPETRRNGNHGQSLSKTPAASKNMYRFTSSF